jgi:serine-type D-Ala-D-Ala carboxypeptidase (penicillin-binding protein 5/6)
MRFIAVILYSLIYFVLQANPTSLSFNATLTPPPPSIKAKSYTLMDATTGTIIAEKNSDQSLPPASLTKLMTLYITAEAIKEGRISLDDTVYISTQAWKAPGSRMFLKPNSKVAIKEIIKGASIASGNDASIALAEHIAGSEEAFVSLMNHTALQLGLKQTHFEDATGLPHPKHKTTAMDLARLSQSFIQHFPKFYDHWFHDKWFEHNKIKQSNRNRLLWRHDYIDGIKTGHTKEAGHCLISSGKIGDTRLIAVIMGTSSPNNRDKSSDTLLTYGFRFFETLTFHAKEQPFTTVNVWGASTPNIKAGSKKIISATIPKGSSKNIHLTVDKSPYLIAPIQRGDQVGNISITLKDQTLFSGQLTAINSTARAPWYSYYFDKSKLKITKWLNL